MAQRPYQIPWSLPTDEIADLGDWAQTGTRAGDAILAMSPAHGEAAYRALKQKINDALERLGPTPSVTISLPELPFDALQYLCARVRGAPSFPDASAIFMFNPYGEYGAYVPHSPD